MFLQAQRRVQLVEGIRNVQVAEDESEMSVSPDPLNAMASKSSTNTGFAIRAWRMFRTPDGELSL
jgi:hypothetical protein